MGFCDKSSWKGKISKYCALQQFDYEENVVKRPAVIIGNNILLGHGMDIQNLVDYNYSTNNELRRHVKVKQFIMHPNKSEDSLMLIVMVHNLEADGGNVAVLPIASKPFEMNAIDCTVVIGDSYEPVNPIGTSECKEMLPKLQEDLLCLNYSDSALKGFALICNEELVGLSDPKKIVVHQGPVTYIDIYKHREWLKSSIEEQRIMLEMIGFPHKPNPKRALGIPGRSYVRSSSGKPKLMTIPTFILFEFYIKG